MQNPLKHFKKSQINTDREFDQAHKIKQQILNDSTDEFTIFYGTPHVYQQNIDFLEKNHMKVQESSSNNLTTEIGIAWTDNGEDKMMSQMQNPKGKGKSGERGSHSFHPDERQK